MDIYGIYIQELTHSSQPICIGGLIYSVSQEI